MIPALLREFASAGCFTLDEAVERTGKPREAIKKNIEYLHSRGYLHSIRRGLYVIDPDPSLGSEPDPYVIASKITDPYLLSHHSALELHGVAESAFFRPITVSAAKPFSPFQWRDREFLPVVTTQAILDAGRATLKRSGVKIHITNRELTLVQCAERPDLAGGMSEVLSSIRGFPYVDWGPLLKLLEIFDKAHIYRRTGYLIAVNADRWRPPETVLRTIREHLGRGSTYFDTAPHGGGRYESEWRVIVPFDAPEASMDG